MKIVYFHDAIARLGGLERVLVDKMNYMADVYKYKIYLITTSQGKHPFTYKLSNNIQHINLFIEFHTIYQYPFLKRILINWELNKKLKNKLNNIIHDINPDIIITTSHYKADAICNLKCTAKKIIECHSPKQFVGLDNKTNIISAIYKHWKYQKYNKIIKNKSDVIIVLTNGDAKEWNCNKTLTIPNIVNINPFQLSSLTKKCVMFAGRFAYEKRLDKMLEAWKIVVTQRNDWTLKLIGEGELRAQLMEQCKYLGIEQNVTFIEATKDIAKEYINSSLFLFTSRFEGFGLVLVEAMQCGVPCVSFDCPYGPSDIIDNNVNGYLIENGNVEEFAKATLKLIEDDELRKKMGEAAIEKAKQYLPENIMPKWIELFNNITN